MSGTHPVTIPNPPKVVKPYIFGYGVKVMSIVQGGVQCQQHWRRVHAVRGVAGVHTS
jgi:hypothetical protein